MKTTHQLDGLGGYVVTRGGKKCSCYVRLLPTRDQMELRYGAHDPTCAVYCPSLDPVDQKTDTEYRTAPLGTRLLSGDHS